MAGSQAGLAPPHTRTWFLGFSTWSCQPAPTWVSPLKQPPLMPSRVSSQPHPSFQEAGGWDPPGHCRVCCEMLHFLFPTGPGGGHRAAGWAICSSALSFFGAGARTQGLANASWLFLTEHLTVCIPKKGKGQETGVQVQRGPDFDVEPESKGYYRRSPSTSFVPGGLSLSIPATRSR